MDDNLCEYMHSLCTVWMDDIFVLLSLAYCMIVCMYCTYNTCAYSMAE